MTPAFPAPTADLVCRVFRTIPVVGQIACALRGKHLLLTGGTGFFGQWLLALLHELNIQGAGITVTVVSRQPERFLDKYPVYRSFAWLHWLACDVRELGQLPGRPIDLVLHAATDTSAAAHARPLELFDSIVGGARRVLELAVRGGAQRILFTGSGAQYGNLPDHTPVGESAMHACSSTAIASVYGEGKRVQETLASIYAQQFGIETVLTRCFAFAGPGLPLHAHFAIGNFVRDAVHADSIVLNSSGEAVRSYLHGADLAAWLLFLLTEAQAGEAYNVGSDEAISIAELAMRVGRRLAPQKPVRILGQSGSSRSYYVPQIGKARSLGLDVWTNLDTAIDSMGQWATNEWV